MTSIEYQNHDDVEMFETVLDMIRRKELTNVKVEFSFDVDRLHYKVKAQVDPKIVTHALGLR